jgi:hypothetical protein
MRRQMGLITFEQAMRCGCTPDSIRGLVRRGHWVRVARRLYRSAAVPVTYEQRVLGACLLSGADAVASHMTAAVLHGLAGARPGQVEILLPRVRSHANAIARVHQASPVRVSGVPATSVARTLVDVAGRLPAQALNGMVDDAIVRRLVAPESIARELDVVATGPGRAGSGRIADALEVWTPGPLAGSVPKIQLARMIVAAGFPVPERQVEIFDAAGRLVGRGDLGYSASLVVIEYEGSGGHGPRTVVRDWARANDIIAAGWQLLIATKHTFRAGKARFLGALDQLLRAADAA